MAVCCVHDVLHIVIWQRFSIVFRDGRLLVWQWKVTVEWWQCDCFCQYSLWLIINQNQWLWSKLTSCVYMLLLTWPQTHYHTSCHWGWTHGFSTDGWNVMTPKSRRNGRNRSAFKLPSLGLFAYLQVAEIQGLKEHTEMKMCISVTQPVLPWIHVDFFSFSHASSMKEESINWVNASLNGLVCFSPSIFFGFFVHRAWMQENNIFFMNSRFYTNCNFGPEVFL